MRDTFNSNPLNPHQQIAPSSRLFRFDFARCQSAAQCRDSNAISAICFPPLLLRSFNRRTAIAWQFDPNTVLRAGFGIFSDILPGSVADLIGTNPPYVRTFQGGLLGTVGGTAIAPGVPEQRSRCNRRRQPELSVPDSQQGELSCASPLASPATAFRPSRLRRCRTANCMRHTSCSGVWDRTSVRNDGQLASTIRRHSRCEPALSDAGQRISNCLPGLLRPFPYMQPTDPRFGAVTQFATGANSHYHGLQLTAMKRLGHGLQGQINYTWSHCLDKVSNGGFLQFSAGGDSFSPAGRACAATTAPATTTFGTTSPASMFMNCRSKCGIMRLGYAVNGWQVSGTVFWHSGVPFSVLSTPYSANGNGIVQGSGPQFASLVPGVDPYCRHCNIPVSRSPERCSG